VSIELTLITWVGFVAWACYFAAGGGREGFLKGLAANLAGALWGYGASLVRSGPSSASSRSPTDPTGPA
jgi:hypothetical protein